VSVYLTELYAYLPNLAGISFNGTTNDNNMHEEHTCDYGYGKHIDVYSKECKVCISAQNSNGYKFGEDDSDDPEAKY
jgi:hypothetical protein